MTNSPVLLGATICDSFALRASPPGALPLSYFIHWSTFILSNGFESVFVRGHRGLFMSSIVFVIGIVSLFVLACVVGLCALITGTALGYYCVAYRITMTYNKRLAAIEERERQFAERVTILTRWYHYARQWSVLNERSTPHPFPSELVA